MTVIVSLSIGSATSTVCLAVVMLVVEVVVDVLDVVVALREASCAESTAVMEGPVRVEVAVTVLVTVTVDELAGRAVDGAPVRACGLVELVNVRELVVGGLVGSDAAIDTVVAVPMIDVSTTGELARVVGLPHVVLAVKGTSAGVVTTSSPTDVLVHVEEVVSGSVAVLVCVDKELVAVPVSVLVVDRVDVLVVLVALDVTVVDVDTDVVELVDCVELVEVVERVDVTVLVALVVVTVLVGGVVVVVLGGVGVVVVMAKTATPCMT